MGAEAPSAPMVSPEATERLRFHRRDPQTGLSASRESISISLTLRLIAGSVALVAAATTLAACVGAEQVKPESPAGAVQRLRVLGVVYLAGGLVAARCATASLAMW